MTTLPHSNPENGFALRIGKKLPKRAANLAYVHTDTPAPEKNIVIFDQSDTIFENTLAPGSEQSRNATTDEAGYLQTDEGRLTLARPEILLADSYSLGENPKPLFYVSASRELFDARNSLLRLSLSGAFASTAKRFEQYRAEERNRFVYEGDKIRLTQTGGVPLTNADRYKIWLEKAGSDAFTYRIVVESNFQEGTNGYEIHYPAYLSGRNIMRMEILNPKTRYTEVTDPALLVDNPFAYCLEAAPGGYNVRLEKELSQPFLLTPANRPPYRFRYAIEADLKTRLSEKNPAKLAVGLIYINDTVFNAVKVTSAMKKLVFQNPSLPAYLQFYNPHPENGAVPSDSIYWLTDVEMPREHYQDYDILILAGYGDKDLTAVAENLQAFFAKGGTLLVDNCGSGQAALNTKNNEDVQTFIADIGFSSSTLATQRRVFTENALFRDRYFSLTDNTLMAMGSANAAIEWGGSESLDDWTVEITHENGTPALLRRNVNRVGTLIVSNMGLMLDVLYGKPATLSFFSNYWLHLAENRSFLTPVIEETVVHRDNLYPTEYTDANGSVRYLDDQNDSDETQIVAKKLLAPSVATQVLPYLPKAYRSYQSGSFRLRLLDAQALPVENPAFETLPANGTTSWSASAADALPGWDFVVGNGTATGSVSESVFYSGRRAFKLETTASQAYLEQAIGFLPAGKYLLEVRLRGENANGSPFGIYRNTGESLAEAFPLSGSFNWVNHSLAFELLEGETALLRIGSLAQTTAVFHFDDIRLANQGDVRMTPDGNGNETLYAYALTPQGKNLEAVLEEATNNAAEIVRIETTASVAVAVTSFVYEWDIESNRYQKQYGNKKETRFTLSASQGEAVLSDLLPLLPPLKAGREWARKDRVYYEVTVSPEDADLTVTGSVYDPSVSRYFFSPAGEWVINHNDLRWNSIDSTVQVRATLKADTLKTTTNRYSVQLQDRNRIAISAPATTDERDRWYLRVTNGSFQKNSTNAKDAVRLAEAGRPDFYDERLVGTHTYALPEYRRQTFYPQFGQRLITQERATYLDERTLRVNRTPLIIEEETVEREVLTPLGTDNLLFQSRHLFWNKNADRVPRIYLDEFGTNEPVLLTTGFVIDYEEGLVRFEAPRSGVVLASYWHDNFRINKRSNSHKRIRKETLPSADRLTFDSKHTNWLVSPAPILRRGAAVIHPGEYIIDYASGTVRFFQKVKENITAEYSYFAETEIAYADANRFTGEIRLEKPVSFRDEVYVSYLAEEPALEYKGYYNEAFGRFLHLDLNPTAGHTFTLRQNEAGETRFVEAAGEKLLGKEVFLYLLPQQSVYYDRTRENEHCLRHVFGKADWLAVQAADPNALLLAKIQVRENTSIEQAVVLDARRPGGGLKESVSDARIQRLVGQTSAFWDIGSFDGLAYYKNGVLVVRVPETVLDANGGPFSEQQVRGILDKYMAYGVYPIIEYRGKDQPRYRITTNGQERPDAGARLTFSFSYWKDGAYHENDVYFVVYEKGFAALTMDEYQKLLNANTLVPDKEYIISDNYDSYMAQYLSEEPENNLIYTVEKENAFVLVMAYADLAHTQLLARIIL